MNFPLNTLPVAAAFATAINSYGAVAQESNRALPVATALTSTGGASAAGAKKACDDLTVIAAMDVTGSFADYLTKTEDLFKNSIAHMRDRFPRNLCIDSEVKTFIVGHSHRDVSGSLDHLSSKKYKVSRNYYSATNVVDAVVKDFTNLRNQLITGALKQQDNTALEMVFDHISEVVRSEGKPCVIFMISDGDETENSSGIAKPKKPGMLAQCKVYMYGAGITLSGGNQAQRKLSAQWDRYMNLAGVAAKDFYWLPNP